MLDMHRIPYSFLDSKSMNLRPLHSFPMTNIRYPCMFVRILFARKRNTKIFKTFRFESYIHTHTLMKYRRMNLLEKAFAEHIAAKNTSIVRVISMAFGVAYSAILKIKMN